MNNVRQQRDYQIQDRRWAWPQRTWFKERLQVVRAEKQVQRGTLAVDPPKPIPANDALAANKDRSRPE